MKTKLTITVDDELIPRAKRYARTRRQSLSSLIEDALRRAIGSEEDFAEKWRGEFTLDDRDEPRYRHLKDKYLANSDRR